MSKIFLCDRTPPVQKKRKLDTRQESDCKVLQIGETVHLVMRAHGLYCYPKKMSDLGPIAA